MRDMAICNSCEFKKQYKQSVANSLWTPLKDFSLVKCDRCDICYNYPDEFVKRLVDGGCLYFEAQLVSHWSKIS